MRSPLLIGPVASVLAIPDIWRQDRSPDQLRQVIGARGSGVYEQYVPVRMVASRWPPSAGLSAARRSSAPRIGAGHADARSLVRGGRLTVPAAQPDRGRELRRQRLELRPRPGRALRVVPLLGLGDLRAKLLDARAIGGLRCVVERRSGAAIGVDAQPRRCRDAAIPVASAPARSSAWSSWPGRSSSRARYAEALRVLHAQGHRPRTRSSSSRPRAGRCRSLRGAGAGRGRLGGTDLGAERRHPETRAAASACDLQVRGAGPSPGASRRREHAARSDRLCAVHGRAPIRSLICTASSRWRAASSSRSRVPASRPRYRSTAPTLPSAWPIAWRPASGAAARTGSPPRRARRGGPRPPRPGSRRAATRCPGTGRRTRRAPAPRGRRAPRRSARARPAGTRARTDGADTTGNRRPTPAPRAPSRPAGPARAAAGTDEIGRPTRCPGRG